LLNETKVLFSQAFCTHRQVAAEGFFVSGQFGQYLIGTYLLVDNRSVIILPIRPKSAPGIALWREGFKGNEPEGIENSIFLYASIMKYCYHAIPTNIAKKSDE